MPIQYVNSDLAPIPAGHYSQATIANGFIFIAGQTPIIPSLGQMPEGIKAQTEQVFNNINSILHAANARLRHLVSIDIFITTIDYWTEVNTLFQHYLDSHKPARTIIPCGTLRNGALIIANAVAVYEC